MVEHFDDGLWLHQPTKRSPHFDFLLGDVYLEMVRWLVASVL